MLPHCVRVCYEITLGTLLCSVRSYPIRISFASEKGISFAALSLLPHWLSASRGTNKAQFIIPTNQIRDHSRRMGLKAFLFPVIRRLESSHVKANEMQLLLLSQVATRHEQQQQQQKERPPAPHTIMIEISTGNNYQTLSEI